MNNEKQDAFKLKVLTSFVLTFSFFLASISGIILFLSPKGRIANWINWTTWSLDKEQWAAVHMSFVAIMLLSGLLHLFWFNWSSFWSYLRSRTAKVWRHQLELWLSLGLCLLFWLGTVYDFPPAGSINRLADAIDASYEVEQNEPPVPHAEEWSIAELAAQYEELTTQDVIAKLRAAGFSVQDSSQLISAIAATRKVAPRELLAVLAERQKLTPDPEAPQSFHTPGQGVMTVQEYCELKGIDPELGLARLQQAGFEDVRPDRIIKEYAAEREIAPAEVAKILHLGEPQK